jgi:hypothetical protein
MRLGLGVLACVLAASLAQAATLAVDSPTNDTILLGAKIVLTGQATPDSAVGDGVKVRAGQAIQTVPVAKGRWRVEIPLPEGQTVIDLTYGDQTLSLLLTHGKDIQGRGTQPVRFEWEPRAIDRLKEIARSTLDQVSDAGAVAFATGVKQLVPILFKQMYRGVNLVESAVDGPEVHVVRMTGAEGGVYGSSPYDCGNSKKRETSTILVGTYARQMEDLDAWPPMSKTDSLQTRIEDVSYALARTAAHEVGHSLGFVGYRVGRPCDWMLGCDEGHNCPEVNASYPMAERFAEGALIMDPGNKTWNHFRISEERDSQRGLRRHLSRFSTFDLSYLAVVHPLK